MFTATKAIFFKCVSGLHAGSGTDLGIVDLPIQRERHTRFPKIESSGVKGCFRDAFRRIDNNALPSDFIDVAFGPDDDGDKHSGAVTFTDGRILLFPVRSARGIFAYITCPYVLSRLAEDCKYAGIGDIPQIAVDETALCSGTALLIPGKGKAVLEEYTYPAMENGEVKSLAETIAAWLESDGYRRDFLLNNLIVLPNDDFSDFVQNATEIITRIKISDETGTVEPGALFSEELLPAETVMYSLVMASSLFLPKNHRENSDGSEEKKGWKKSPTLENAEKNGKQGKYILDTIQSNMPAYLQMGGDATIGKGIVRVSVKGGD
jgi:CRISPR-associated protein Cmr4